MNQFPQNQEIWRAVDGFMNFEVSNHGRVRNVKNGRMIKQTLYIHNKTGYKQYLCHLSKLVDGRRFDKRAQLSRLVALAFCANPNDETVVDHLDNNSLNNHYTNLRWCTSQQNQWNTTKQRNKTSVYKGVYFHQSTQKWTAQITINKKQTHLGLFLSEVDAAHAYDAKARIHFGEFAKLNF
jgi:hypothetical protein